MASRTESSSGQRHRSFDVPVLQFVEEQAGGIQGFLSEQGFNRVSEDRQLKPLIFHSLKGPLRCLTLGRKITHNMLQTHTVSTSRQHS